ncbi:tetratricopeptide repeat protein [Paraburkholderia phymatum]|uniref:TPR repeat-containing protein n=1 Tax=Paraburkholderia phymatum (strain DSM 17167 / CIP 108236 / LMG 21445 / STM815) TaxID=391038 RepID=B2JDH0_PARP8|nr:tetratricopeptide repeat protein [Paraburkholderia phymatum]ACC69687.1 TPR repeat-containing protein [Paraburkholderia phymatum STM815]
MHNASLLIYDNTSPASVEHALALHRAGDLDRAGQAYRAILDLQPDDANTRYMLGVLHLQRQEVERAIECFDASLALQPDHADCLNDRGIAALSRGDHEDAAHFFRRATECAPHDALAHCNLGKALRRLSKPEEALASFQRALALDDGDVEAALGSADMLETLARPHEAVTAYEYAARFAPDDMRVLLGLGLTLNAVCRHADAAACFERALRQEPENVHALFGIAFAIDGQLKFEEAVLRYQRALEVLPHSPTLLNNIAFTLTCLSRYDEADEHLRRAIEIAPDLSNAHKLLGMSELRRGNFRKGWTSYEHRKTTQSGLHDYPPLDFPEWEGEPLDGKRFLLAREQGAGDQLQFIRYAGVLHDLGATVDVWTSDELTPLFARMRGVQRVLTQAPTSGYDYYCRMMSVPTWLDDEAIPHAVPYLSAAEAEVDAWRARIGQAAGSNRRVGLVWAGNPQHYLDVYRSAPLAALEPLASVRGFAWFALQKGAPESQLDGVAHRWPICALGEWLDSFHATAALIESLDLVITVDTSVAHLAGALGKPVWVLLPKQADWRWMMSGDTSPWYPTARLFRQQVLGDWTPVVESVRGALEAL